jgi:hypothetical protein
MCVHVRVCVARYLPLQSCSLLLRISEHVSVATMTKLTTNDVGDIGCEKRQTNYISTPLCSTKHHVTSLFRDQFPYGLLRTNDVDS